MSIPDKNLPLRGRIEILKAYKDADGDIELASQICSYPSKTVEYCCRLNKVFAEPKGKRGGRRYSLTGRKGASTIDEVIRVLEIYESGERNTTKIAKKTKRSRVTIATILKTNDLRLEGKRGPATSYKTIQFNYYC